MKTIDFLASQSILLGLKNIHVSEHFTLYEFLHSETAIKHQIINFPDRAIIYENLTILSSFLECFRSALGYPINLNSGYRCYEVNNLVGGKSNSYHLSGLAADIKLQYVGHNIYEKAYKRAVEKFKTLHPSYSVSYYFNLPSCYMHVQLKNI